MMPAFDKLRRPSGEAPTGRLGGNVRVAETVLSVVVLNAVLLTQPEQTIELLGKRRHVVVVVAAPLGRPSVSNSDNSDVTDEAH